MSDLKKYCVTLNGKNYRIRWFDGKVRQMGFYKTRYLEAPSAKVAEKAAVQAILDDPRWEGALLNAPDDLPVMYCKSIAEIGTFTGLPNLNPGYVFYPEDDEIEDSDVH